jgi:hypothetical protein
VLCRWALRRLLAVYSQQQPGMQHTAYVLVLKDGAQDLRPLGALTAAHDSIRFLLGSVGNRPCLVASYDGLGALPLADHLQAMVSTVFKITWLDSEEFAQPSSKSAPLRDSSAREGTAVSPMLSNLAYLVHRLQGPLTQPVDMRPNLGRQVENLVQALEEFHTDFNQRFNMLDQEREFLWDQGSQLARRLDRLEDTAGGRGSPNSPLYERSPQQCSDNGQEE